MPPKPGLFFTPGVDEGSLCRTGVGRPRGVQVSASVVGVDSRPNLEGVVVVVAVILVGDAFGVDCRRGEGDAGLSGRWNGEDRGEP